MKQRRELDAENINANANQIAVSNVTTKQEEEEDDKDKEFGEYALRDAICNKWGQCFDADFQHDELRSLLILHDSVTPTREEHYFLRPPIKYSDNFQNISRRVFGASYEFRLSP